MDGARLIAGAMSGTSADGVDVALVRITGRGLEMSATLLRHHQRGFPDELRKKICETRAGGAISLADLAAVGRGISLNYAAAVNEALLAGGLAGADLAAVAAHGQTLYHHPPNTIQWLDPALLASEVGCVVVSDFRRADCAAGGQGAPLVPMADFLLFASRDRNRVLLNLGGIANFTFLAAGGSPENILACDTGPANCILDHLMKPKIDEGGRLASRGEVHKSLMREFLQHDYFHRRPPKSTDGPQMIAAFERAMGRHPDLTLLTDRLATACAITVESIVHAIELYCPNPADEVIASGGGTKNIAMMKQLRGRLGQVPLRTTDELGVPSAAKEAIAFALLGAATLDGVAGNVPSATGARRAVVGGAITPKP